MDDRWRPCLLFILLHHLMVSSFVMACLFGHLHAKRANKRPREVTRRSRCYSMTTRSSEQLDHLRRITDVGDVECIVNLRMNRNAFGRLCELLTGIGGVRESRNVRAEEKVASFLSTLGHHKKVRIIGHDYMRSTHTISVHFHEVLVAVLRLHTILLVKPAPIGDDCDNEPWKWFKGCLGALDGTLIAVNVSNVDKARFRTRKGTTAINVLGVCDRYMNFIYAHSGWEGSAADARVLRDALCRDNGLKVPRGCYYLCDNGYANVEGFLTPYRRVRYHRDAWGLSAPHPQNYKESFNYKHSQARNVIERAFGLLKKRWAILRSPSFYPLKTHNRIVMACILLHNFIRSQMPVDPIDVDGECMLQLEEEVVEDYIEGLESSAAWDDWRDVLATAIFLS